MVGEKVIRDTLFWIDGAVCECGHEFSPADLWGDPSLWPVATTQADLRRGWEHANCGGGRISFLHPRQYLVTKASTPGTMESPWHDSGQFK
jgi:hypothetical protein